MRRSRKGRLTSGDRSRCACIAASLVKFYREHGRTFPWRLDRQPYSTALVEILLTKTRAESVVPVYSLLLARYPSPIELAASDPSDLEKLIGRLGLSRKRAKSLRGLASALVDGGLDVLSDPESSISLPGIWRYGSRAIACFAYGKAVGIVDANVRRVLTRAFALRLTRGARIHLLADAIAGSAKDAADANYGLLDIGALFCKRVPICIKCPISGACKYAEGKLSK
jgi:A/G-specific adenine glycosylase